MCNKPEKNAIAKISQAHRQDREAGERLKLECKRFAQTSFISSLIMGEDMKLETEEIYKQAGSFGL